MSEITILVGADLVPTKTNRQLFVDGDIDTIIGEQLKEICEKSDFRIFNLELPLTDCVTPIRKHGPNFSAATDTIKGIKALNPSLFTLANNHIMDQGEQGFISTSNLLKEYRIPMVGAGANLKEATKPYIINQDGTRVGIYACADHEFSIAAEEKMGANPFNPLESLDHISDLSKICDCVIVLYHGGNENYRYPSPYLQKVCRKMSDKGADIIICQHSHCIGCFEQYHDSTIVYGQGNFLFDDSDSELWMSGLLICLSLERRYYSVNYIPLEKRNHTVRLANMELGNAILHSFQDRSKKILIPGFIEEEYRKLADQTMDAYLKALHGGGYFYRFVNKISRNRLIQSYSEKQLLAIENYVTCDAHRELLLSGIKNRYEKRDYN